MGRQPVGTPHEDSHEPKDCYESWKTTHETKHHENDFPRDRGPIQMGNHPMKTLKTDTKTTFENQRTVTNNGKKTHETKHDFPRIKGPLRIDKTTHETRDELDFSRDKESILLKGQPTKTDKTT